MSVRWSEEQLAAHLGGKKPKAAAPDQSYLALGRLPPGQMNKTEAAYAEHLRLLLHAGTILWFKFEGIKLRLADNTFLTVDFAVLPKSGIMEMHEVKGGWWQDDARVKIKVAASIYPFRFIAVMPIRKGGWKMEEF